MEIVYAKPISEQIVEAQAEAEREGRVIEKIILTETEYNQLKAEAARSWGISRRKLETPCRMFCGVRLEVQEEEF